MQNRPPSLKYPKYWANAAPQRLIRPDPAQEMRL
jgi:hypothetical protein